MKTLVKTLHLMIAMVCFLFVVSSCKQEAPNATQNSTPAQTEKPAPPSTQAPVQNNTPEKEISVKDGVTEKELKELGYEKPVEASANEVDYPALANAYCDCSSASKKLNDEMQALEAAGQNSKFQQMAPKVDEAFRKAVDCAKKQKNKATNKALNKGVLVKEMKGVCPDLPAKLVMDLITKA